MHAETRLAAWDRDHSSLVALHDRVRSALAETRAASRDALLADLPTVARALDEAAVALGRAEEGLRMRRRSSAEGRPLG